MAETSDVEERLRELERSREALLREVSFLRSREDDRRRRIKRDLAWLPLTLVVSLVLAALITAGIVAISKARLSSPSTGNSSFTAYPRPGG